MSNSSLVSYTKISPNKNPRNHAIDTITIHCFVGQVHVERMGESFASKSSQQSCNYGIGKDGRIGMYVEEKDRSWCSSNRANDHRAITIECASSKYDPYEINDKVMDSLIKLLADICKRNNIKQLKWKADKSLIGQPDKQNMTVHRWFANKKCPGNYIYSRLGEIAANVNALLGVKTEVEEVVTPIEPVVTTPATSTYKLTTFIKQIQKACGAKVDGIAGSETISKTVTVSETKNRRHSVVAPIQKRLYSLGYTEVGTADGIAGPKFTSAVKHFQKDNGCVVDGEITAKRTTWRKLLEMK